MGWEDVDLKTVPPQYRGAVSADAKARMTEPGAPYTSPTSAPPVVNRFANYMADVGEGAADIARYTGQQLQEAWSGDKRRTGDYPELTSAIASRGGNPNGPVTDNAAGMAAAFANATATDPLGYANIMKNWLPNSKITFDVNNNPLINWNGETYYANKPGASGNDFARLATDMAAFYPASKWASLGKSALGRAGKSGAGAYITTALQQLAGQAGGSEENFSFGMPAVAGMGGIASEVLAPFLGAGAQNLWLRLGKGVIADKSGAPTPFGRSFVEQVGLDPSNMSAGTWSQLDKYYRSLDQATREAMERAGKNVMPGTMSAGPGAASLDAFMAQADNGAIPKTMGQQTRNQEQLDMEEFARTGRLPGAGVRETMSAMDNAQSAAVMGRAQNLQEMAGNGQIRSQTPEALGAQLQGGMKQAEEGAWNNVGAAYAAVPDGVRLQADPLMQLPNAVSGALRQASIFPDRAGFDVVYPRTSKALADMRNVLAEKAALPPSKRSFGLMELEQERRAVNQLMKGAEAADMTGLTLLKNQFDAHIEKTWDDALIKGDPAALDQLKAARRARTDYAKMFEPENVDATVKNTIQKMINQPDIDNNQVVNWVLGSAETGFGKAGYQMVKQLGNIFGKGSEEFSALREAAMMKVIYGGSSNAMRDAMWNSDKVVSKSSGMLLRRLDNFLDLDGSQVMKELFTKPELDQLRRFRYELRQIQPGENAPTLRTGASQSLWMMKVGSWIDGAIRMKAGGLPITPIQSAGEVAQGFSNRAKAEAAAGGWLPPEVRSIPLFQSFLTGAAASGAPTLFEGQGQQ